jgi:hypothetical protein
MLQVRPEVSWMKLELLHPQVVSLNVLSFPNCLVARKGWKTPGMAGWLSKPFTPEIFKFNISCIPLNRTKNNIFVSFVGASML